MNGHNLYSHGKNNIDFKKEISTQAGEQNCSTALHTTKAKNFYTGKKPKQQPCFQTSKIKYVNLIPHCDIQRLYSVLQCKSNEKQNQ